ncbi:hypothetical protein BGZ91_006321 [Linnemannia elongata]|nr:hypothetical protein BGZ91_006321 [Linnemannia elongata]
MSYNDNSTVLLDCIATNPSSTTLYGITNGLINGEEGFLLVKSLPNPDHLSLGMWSRVSFSQAEPFSYWKMPFGTVDCTVSSKGVFTAFFRNKDYISPKPADVPVGIRYDPETETWTSITTSFLYGWDTDSAAHLSFYINSDGVDTLVHMFMDDEGSVIRFGVLNETKKYLQLASVWSLNEISGEYTVSNKIDLMPKPRVNQMELPRPGFFRRRRSQGCIKAIYVESHLYMIHHNYDISTNVFIESYPFTDPTAPPSLNRQIFKGPDNFLSSYFFTGTREGITFLGGLGQDNKTAVGQDYTSFTMDIVNGVLQNPIMSTSSFYDITTIFDGNSTKTNGVAVHDNFVTLDGQPPGQTPYVVGLSSEGVYQFSIIGKNGTNSLGSLDVVIPGVFRGIAPRNTTMENLFYRDKDWVRYITKAQVLVIIFGVTAGLFCCIMYRHHREKLKRREAEEKKEQDRQQLQQQRRQQQQQQQQVQYVEMELRGANMRTVKGERRQHYTRTSQQHYYYHDDDDDDDDHLRGGRGRDQRARIL